MNEQAKEELFTLESFKNTNHNDAVRDEPIIHDIIRKMYDMKLRSLYSDTKWIRDPVLTYSLPHYDSGYSRRYRKGTLDFSEFHSIAETECMKLKAPFDNLGVFSDITFTLAYMCFAYTNKTYGFAAQQIKE